MTATAASRHILFLDDDVEYGLLFEAVLKRAGHQVTVFVAATAALAALAANPQAYNFLVTDFHMPGMDGLEFVRAVRHLGADLPCVVISSDQAALERASAEPAVSAVAPKPTNLHEFVALVTPGNST
jgi:CheY-like chemotaxis protein